MARNIRIIQLLDNIPVVLRMEEIEKETGMQFLANGGLGVVIRSSVDEFGRCKLAPLVFDDLEGAHPSLVKDGQGFIFALTSRD